MSDDESIRPLGRIDTNRRTFLQKSAIASGAIALGGASVGSVAGQTDGEEAGDGERVFMLYPDAVEHASAQVISEEIDWLPWEDDEAEMNGDANGTDGENGNGAGTNQDGAYRTHLAQFAFSASHVVPVFVPQDADVALEDDIQLGEMEELLTAPDEPLEADGMGTGNGENGAGNETDDGQAGVGVESDQAILVSVTLEEADTTENGVGDGTGEDNGTGGENGAGPGAEENETDNGNESEEDDGLFRLA